MQNPYDPSQTDNELLRQLMGGPSQMAYEQGGVTGGVNTQGQRVDKEAPAGAPTAAARAANPNDASAFLREVLGGQAYGIKGLEAAQPELEKAGYKVQFGDGFTRGRVYDPSGRQWDVFDQAEGRTKEDNWSTNPRGTAWDIRDMGMPQQGGGGGGGVVPAGVMPGQGVLGSMPTDRGFFEQLMALLRKETGNEGSLDRNALLSLLGT